MNRSRAAVLGWLLAALLLSSCTTPDLLQTTPPPLEIGDPNLLGEAPADTRTLRTLDDTLRCLQSGRPVFGIAVENSNVRAEADADSCRVGRLPAGALVRAEAVHLAGEETRLTDFSAYLSAENAAATEVGGVRGTIVLAMPNAEEAAETTGETAGETADPAEAEAPAGPGLGYAEDVQPIFQRTCNSCHSAIVQNAGLQVTAYEPLMAGSAKGAVVLPGDPDGSLLWHMISTGKMPLVGELADADKEIVRAWIAAGAPERRAAPAAPRPTATPTQPSEGSPDLWLVVDGMELNDVPDECALTAEPEHLYMNSELLMPLNCGAPPQEATLAAALAIVRPRPLVAASAPAADGTAPRPQEQAGEKAPADTAPALSSAEGGNGAQVVLPAAAYAAGAGDAGIQAAAFGLAGPSDSDGWLQSRGGFCVEQRFNNNSRSITAMAFAPDGRLFLALDSPPAGEDVDPLVLYDAYHPSRSIGTIDPATGGNYQEVLRESTRITGLSYANGALYISRAGEVGRIPDGGAYERLAAGFAVTSNLFHANNGIVVSDGWVYVSAGGVRDGYSDGPLVGISEAGAMDIVSGGNPYAARLVRAPLDQLVSTRSINVFQTAARGLRNPYGVARDPAGRIWFTDNGATNVPDNVAAGDEVSVFNPASATGVDATAPFYGFPLALTTASDSFVGPVVNLPNTAAPTGITWAYGTIFYGQYGRDPGLYRLGRSGDGSVISERVMLVWPLLALATAPDGALWMGTGTGGLFRLTPGCN